MDADPPSVGQPRPTLVLAALHLAGLWNLGVVQPVFDVVAENPEFFVAHRTRGIDLAGLVLLLCVVGPLCVILPTVLAAGVSRRIGKVVLWGAVTGLLTLVALPIVNRTWGFDAAVAFGVAIALGAGVAGSYMVLAPVRLFVSFLSLATLVVPAVFVLQPSIAGFLWADTHEPLADVRLETTPPVVMVVFDQLPLSSLLDRDGQIDEALYPNFSALAADGSWFRHAAAVADLTHFAVPALLTGNDPEPDLLPVTADHPNNLFTWLGSQYRVEAFEPLTRLCPESLCPIGRPPPGLWYGSVLLDLGVVYLHIILPDELTAALPPVTQNWKDFAAGDTWRSRWNRRRRTDRRDEVRQFIDSIEPLSVDDRPPFHFLHLLLPHEPWIYLPTGQRFATSGDTVGLARSGRWADDDLAVARNYQRHLLQVRYADTLLGQVLDHLRAVGMYGDAVVIVAADHGGAFQPGVPFRRPRSGSFVDIAAVPLLIKASGQERGQVVESYVQTTDIVPTIAGLLGAELPWEVDGFDALGPAVEERTRMRLRFEGAKQEIVGPRQYARVLRQVVAGKYRLFNRPDGFHQPQLGPYRGLAGRAVSEFQVDVSPDVQATVDFPTLFEDVDPGGDFLPTRLIGAVHVRDDPAVTAVDLWLGIAVNGVLAGVTRPYGFLVHGRRDVWELVIDPQFLRDGANTLEVFVIDRSSDGSVVLQRANDTTEAIAEMNLIGEEAAVLSGVVATGFYGTEWAGQRSLRWTSEQARIVVPVDPDTPPSALTVDVLMTGPPAKSVRIALDECLVFEGEIQGRWRQTFPVGDCRIEGDTVGIQIDTEVHTPGGPDRRALGLGVSAIELRD